ncbi:porin [Runella salmonicolor]|uniref:Porin n=1 Tax=Runella salmonicolor TaxID=2950278 RepID=A0ABT1FVN1_9BACT|nr:porin [Runella salmonicolor]MCP1385829.1 porin [Runella salmonicolor]
MKKIYFFLLIIFGVMSQAVAQIDSTLFKRSPKPDSAKVSMNMDAVYNRPFLQVGRTPLGVGGYAELNTNYAATDGISEGLSFQMRRMTLFFGGSLHRKIKFMSELEFEDGTKEINIEFAAIDFQFANLFNLRGGVIMNPIGAFNQNHDGPRWEFSDRPIAATQMLPATFSNVGMGIYGKKYTRQWVFAYEAYLTNGFNDNIIANEDSRTSLPATKANKDRFEESSNGQPMFTGKVAIRNRKIGELGISYMGGVYNKFENDGFVLDKKRLANVFAVDFNTTIKPTKTFITAEWAWINVDVPETYSVSFGKKQSGGFVDIVQPVFKKPLWGFPNSTFNIACRVERVDWNVGTFAETNDKIFDELFSIMPAISWRPIPSTVMRFSYRIQRQWDLLGNPPARTGAIQLGISSYF